MTLAASCFPILNTGLADPDFSELDD